MRHTCATKWRTHVDARILLDMTTVTPVTCCYYLICIHGYCGNSDLTRKSVETTTFAKSAGGTRTEAMSHHPL